MSIELERSPQETAFRRAAHTAAINTIRNLPFDYIWNAKSALRLSPEYVLATPVDRPQAYALARTCIPETSTTMFSEVDKGLFPLDPKSNRLKAFLRASIDEGSLEQKLESIMTELANGGIRIALIGPRGIGKSITFSALATRLEARKKVVHQSKFSGFIKPPEEERFLKGLSASQSERIRLDSLIPDLIPRIMKIDDPRKTLRIYIDAVIDYYLNVEGQFPSTELIREAATYFVTEVPKFIVNRRYSGDYSRRMLQDINLMLLNNFYNPDSRHADFHISDGGHIERDFMFHRYNRDLNITNPYAVSLGSLLPRKSEIFTGSPNASTNEYPVVSLPLPAVTYYLQLKENQLKSRIERDENVGPEKKADRLDALKNVEFLDKLARDFQDKLGNVKIIFAHHPTDWIVDSIMLDLEERGLI